MPYHYTFFVTINLSLEKGDKSPNSSFVKIGLKSSLPRLKVLFDG